MNRFLSLAFVAILALGGFVNTFFHTDLSASAEENRTLQQRPAFSFDAYFSGEYTLAVDQYISDQFVGRADLMRISSVLSELKGLPAESVEVIRVQNDNTASKPDRTEDPDLQSAPIRQSEFIITSDRGFANHIENPLGEYHYASALNAFAKAHPDLDITLMLPPTKVDFYTPEAYQDLTDIQRVSIDHIAGLLDPSIRFIDVYETLESRKEEYLYLRTDHHWTALGAYCAYETYARTLELPVFDLASANEVVVEDFLGSLYTMTQSETVAAYPDTIVGYAPSYPVRMVTDFERVDEEIVGFFGYDTANYGMFLNGDAGLKVITSEAETAQGSILVIKDSYANAFVPYLTANYQEIHVVDPRHFEGPIDPYIEANNIRSVLFFNSAAIGKYDSFHEVLYSLFGEVE